MKTFLSCLKLIIVTNDECRITGRYRHNGEWVDINSRYNSETEARNKIELLREDYDFQVVTIRQA